MLLNNYFEQKEKIYKYDYYRFLGKKVTFIDLLKEFLRGNSKIYKFLYVYRNKKKNIICKLLFKHYVKNMD